jgi:magnesium chelatase family protein
VVDEQTLANRRFGVRVAKLGISRLLLDELSEFARPTLEALRQPLEEGRVAIVRARHSSVYPARFMLVAATNPCPCGYAGVEERCRCSEAELARHRRRFSGPLLDRIDLLVGMERQALDRVDGEMPKDSRRTREHVIEARERQARRFERLEILVNAQMDTRTLRDCVKLDRTGEQMLRSCQERGALSVRGQHRALRVARTIADLAGSRRVFAEHLGQALSLRPESGFSARRTA